MKIIVNGRNVELDNVTTLSYEDVVKLAGKDGNPTVVYSGPRRGDVRRSGSMHHGCTPVTLEQGMAFSVVHTGNA